MENFHWSLTEADKLSFSLVTLRAAVEYIRGPEVDKLLPKTEETKKQVTSYILYLYNHPITLSVMPITKIFDLINSLSSAQFC